MYNPNLVLRLATICNLSGIHSTHSYSTCSSKMPDGQTVAIGSERFRCPEVMFTPSMVGMATDGVHEVIYKTALQCAIDVRSSLFQNIVISGKSVLLFDFLSEGSGKGGGV